MKHKLFIDKITDNIKPPSKETLYKAVDYFKHDSGALDMFLKQFNESLTENKDNRDILNKIISDKDNYNNLYDYIKENKLIVTMLDTIEGFSSNFLTNQNIDFLIGFTISLSKFSDEQIDGLKTIDNTNNGYYYKSLILSMADLIIKAIETPEIVFEKTKQFDVIKSTNYQPNTFLSSLYQEAILDNMHLDIELLIRIVALFEVG